jgi:hypothetical protein
MTDGIPLAELFKQALRRGAAAADENARYPYGSMP